MNSIDQILDFISSGIVKWMGSSKSPLTKIWRSKDSIFWRRDSNRPGFCGSIPAGPGSADCSHHLSGERDGGIGRGGAGGLGVLACRLDRGRLRGSSGGGDVSCFLFLRRGSGLDDDEDSLRGCWLLVFGRPLAWGFGGILTWLKSCN